MDNPVAWTSRSFSRTDKVETAQDLKANGNAEPRRKEKRSTYTAPVERWYTPIQLRPWVVRAMGHQPKTRTGSSSSSSEEEGPRVSPFRQFIEEIVAAKISEHLGAKDSISSHMAENDIPGGASRGSVSSAAHQNSGTDTARRDSGSSSQDSFSSTSATASIPKSEMRSRVDTRRSTQSGGSREFPRDQKEKQEKRRGRSRERISPRMSGGLNGERGETEEQEQERTDAEEVNGAAELDRRNEPETSSSSSSSSSNNNNNNNNKTNNNSNDDDARRSNAESSGRSRRSDDNTSTQALVNGRSLGSRMSFRNRSSNSMGRGPAASRTSGRSHRSL